MTFMNQFLVLLPACDTIAVVPGRTGREGKSRMESYKNCRRRVVDGEKAAAYLSKDPLLHMDMFECIRRGEAEVLYASGEGVLLRHMCGVIMMSAATEEAAEEMLGLLDRAELLVAHQEFYLSAVKSKFGISAMTPCLQAVYPSRQPLRERSDADIRRLGKEYLPFLQEHYSHADGSDYLCGRLAAGAVFGAFAGGRLTGFIGIHEEGAMGMLEVLPEYRRRGIAAALAAFLANRLLEEGRVPYSHIILGNGVSLSLHRKLGFSISAGMVYWSGLDQT